MEDRLFLELLQIAIGTRQSLSIAPSSNQWSELFALSEKHALVAIAFNGLSLLKSHSSNPDDFGHSLGIDEFTYLKWFGMTVKIAQRNRELNAECARVCHELAHDGLCAVVLKGQSNLVYYPESIRECRASGDIDLWCDAIWDEENTCSTEKRKFRGLKGVIQYCKKYEHSQGRDIPWHRVLYYHCEIKSASGIDIEPHYRPTYLNSPLRNRRLQSWFRENEPWGRCAAKLENHVFPILPISTNVVYQLLHVYKHFFEQGIGLRQLLDYFFVIRAFHREQGENSERTSYISQKAEGIEFSIKSNEDIMNTLGRFGMKRFAAAVMYVLQKVFAMPDDFLLCPANEKEGKFLLNEIMKAGNFGKYDERIKHGGSRSQHAWEKTKRNLRLLSHYPEEVICEPFFKLYHWIWRRFELWRY